MPETKPANTKPKSGRWPKGNSGNPAGRPPGSRNKSTLFFEELLSDQGEALIQKAIQLSLKGDTVALRLCLERICPPRKDRTLEMPELTGFHPVSSALPLILTAVGEGRLTPGEAESLARVVESQIRVVEVEELARRVAELERARTSRPDESQEQATVDWITRNYANQSSAAGAEGSRTTEEQSTDRTTNEIDGKEQSRAERSTPPVASPIPKATR